MKVRIKGLGILLLFAGLLLAACSGGATEETDAGGTAVAGTEVTTGAEEAVNVADETKVVHDQFGEVTIPAHPKNLVVLNSIYAEYLIEMGITPQIVLYTPEVEAEYRPAYFKEHGVQIIEIEQYQMNYEQLLALSPDMLLTAGEGMEQSVYDELSKIAPTVALDSNSEMTRAMPKLAAIFDKSEKAASILTEFDEKAKQAREKIAAALGNKTVLVLRVEHDRYRFMGPKGGNSSIFFYNTLGLNSPEAIKDSTVWFNPFSLEFLPEMSPDYIFLEDRTLKGYDTKQSMENLKQSKLWKNLEAVKNDHVFPLKTSEFTSGVGPIGSVKLMDYVVEKLVP
ncbi:ABC transporter substrate-binding protein [Paenibacillus silvae]|uniref:ABC transporter substrate-binding protein n=1 Tax=Paenibacillus silvae TaxID=1325358 RepID=UPI0011A47A1C|nr:MULTISPECIES: ABC transporter substrate-binding protein [Paenibacillus]MCK6075208.1 ABC transporter substrate-binding protein [Paenibacillus silvae]MCK6149595.1 ABC transporter substrate-binding protein [Paenibacillus silvae]MCK6267893.1 ABC transporter substrate-binding protein [Paenibacillus silvae]